MSDERFDIGDYLAKHDEEMDRPQPQPQPDATGAAREPLDHIAEHSAAYKYHGELTAFHLNDVIQLMRDFAASRTAGLEQQLAERGNQLVEIQKHRDAWRGYAYGNRPKPDDFLDGNMVQRGVTVIESAEARATELENLLAEAQQFICDGSHSNIEHSQFMEKINAVLTAPTAQPEEK